jgi:fructose-specific phosphotransferase system IIA component
MNLLDILSPNAIKVPLEATDKKAAIFELIDVLDEADLINDAKTLRKVVWDREQQRSTGIGQGLAIPHGKSKCSKELVMAVGRPASPIEFDAVDKKPVQLIVLLASPPDKTSEHIQALGKISRLMAQDDVREAAFHADSAEELFELFQQHETAK